MIEVKEKEFIDQVKHKLESKTLVLPTLSNVANEIRNALNNQANLSVHDVAGIIGSDPALSVRIIQVANSALYSNGGQQQKSLEEAIVRLGCINTIQLSTAFAVKQTFSSSSPLVNSYFNEILKQTLSVSATSRGMALFAPNLNAEEAMLAGMVYQIGKLPVLQLYAELQQTFSDQALNTILTKTHPYIGKLILQEWGFSDELVRVPGEYLNFQKNTKEIDYVDIVTVAYLQEMAITFHPHSNIDWSTVPAFAKLGLTTGFDELSQDDVTQEIKVALAVLS